MTRFIMARLKMIVFVGAYLTVCSVLGQANKEDRNYYPKPQPTKKTELKVKKAPLAYSPHLSYKEQKKMQLASKKAGGVTVLIKTRRNKPANYKQPTLSKRATKSAIDSDTAAYTRYQLDTLQ